jgi:hypothetical protein
MALIKCKECNNEVSTTATVCPQCGFQLKPKSMGCGTAILILIGFSIFVLIIIGRIGSTVNKTEEQMDLANCNDAVMSYIKLKRFMTERLKSPTSADFPINPVSTANMGNCKFKITSFVDSQNSYGATIRTRFVGVVRYDKSDNTWNLESLGTN